MEQVPIRLLTAAAALALLALAGCFAAERKPALPFWELAPRHHPPTAGTALPLAAGHPRLIFRAPGAPGAGRTFAEVRRLYASDPTFKAIFDKALAVDVKKQDPAMLATCWIVTGEDRYAQAAIERMVGEELGKSGEPYYSNIWEHALAYDWLFDHPALTAEKKDRIVARMAERLATELADLDDEGMALWHGRNQAANGAMIAALAIGDLPGRERDLERAAGHYLESLRALQVSEGWPEGASYWIYNRAGPYAVAADCVITALGSDRPEGVPIREIMRKIGRWSLYQFGPDGTFEPYGDSSGSLRLGETGWWELSADYYARLARDPELMAGADYLRNRSPAPYGKRPYYWYIALAYDPAARPRDPGYDPAKPELWMREHLPQAMLFGRSTMGVAFFRGRWGDPDETYASFKAGDLLAHHDHYDTGHFSIQKGGLLAPRTGLYGPGGYTGPHRLGYAIQTVASNSLLVLAPGEASAYLRAKRERDPAFWTALSGGQRVIRPTGFSCVSLEHFRDQLRAGPHLERAELTAFESVPNELDYAAADITAAYNSTRWHEPGAVAKVSLVTRQFLYLRRFDAFVVYDRVETTDPRFLPKFLLHSLAKPQTASEKQLAGGGPEDGILETFDRELVTGHKRGRLTQAIVLPEQARALKIGGPHFNCYVESGGDQSQGFRGENLEGGDPAKPRGGKQLGLWRTEVEPTGPGTGVRFLNLLFARTVDEPGAAAPYRRVEAGGEAHAVQVGDTVCVFAREARPLKQLRLAAPGLRCVVLDAVPGGLYAAGAKRVAASQEGVLVLEPLPEGASDSRLVGR
jgi:hypothetical protein